MFKHIGDRNLNITGEPETIMKTHMMLYIIYEQKGIPIYKSERRKCNFKRIQFQTQKTLIF